MKSLPGNSTATESQPVFGQDLAENSKKNSHQRPNINPPNINSVADQH
jgi:hypothetical protein